MDVLLLFGLALVTGGLAFVAPVEVAVGALVCAFAIARARGKAVAALVVLGVALGGTRAALAIASFEAARETGPPSRCTAIATVASSPVRVRDSLRWTARLRDATCDDGTVPHATATLYGGPDDLARGDVVEIVAQLGAPQRLWNDATGDPRPAEARRGVTRSGGAIDVRTVARAFGPFAWIDRARAHVRARIDGTFPTDTAPMARALVLGESDLADGDDAAFRASGLSHLLAVSGMHLVIVVLGATAALRALLSRIEALAARVDVARVAAAIAIPLTFAYASFAGAGGSTVRAAWMTCAAMLARALGRRSGGVRAFAISLVAMAAFDPLVAFDLSFTLSAAATAGLLFLARPLTDTLASRLPSARPFAWAAGSLGTTLAASIPCAPILARFSTSLPLAGALANMLAVPLGEAIALPVCLAHAVLAAWPAAERGCAAVASGALVAVRAIARGFAGASWLSASVPPPSAWQLATMVAAVVAIATHRGSLRRVVACAAAAVLLLLELRARRDGAPRGVLRATFLDVGQGDAAIVDTPDGSALVVDGGGLVGSPIDVGARVLAPELRARRRDAIAIAVLSHPHPDHFGGLASGLAAVRVGSFWDTGQGEREPAGAYAATLTAMRARSAAVVRPSALCGSHLVGGARIEVLAPCPGPAPDVGANDNSFVLRVSFGARAILFVGDAEHDEERALVRLGAHRLRADVLKVGHHGSRTSSTPAFVAAVAPAEAVISTGVRNRFGHPSPSTLATLARAGARVWRTDRDGAVTVTTDGASLDVRASARR